MRERCPHAIDAAEQCPVSCFYSVCERDTHRVTSDPMLVFDPDIDRTVAAKEICTHCEFFLRNAPRIR